MNVDVDVEQGSPSSHLYHHLSPAWPDADTHDNSTLLYTLFQFPAPASYSRHELGDVPPVPSPQRGTPLPIRHPKTTRKTTTALHALFSAPNPAYTTPKTMKAKTTSNLH
ncbi:hypothetical protein CPB84DRAFT_621595 [Gymnopilus junonius]|uniref:Uncharacterized protein n=1 Tax=Gymnopilus junonius TaxID=109634 RepID=A0A9P5N9A4_GYMJU|nr:hypothetical protein CPB84DRAFT_621595 [Gymnopilus junonius]